MYFGKSTLLLSDKRLLTLPSNFHDAGSNVVYITQGFDRNLIALSQKAFYAIYSHLKEISISDPLARLLSRLFLGSAVEVAIDNLGQIELPTTLCEYAELGTEIIIVGQGEYSELWSPAQWKKQEDSISDFDANTRRFEKFHVSLS